jgi:hypothetical protein
MAIKAVERFDPQTVYDLFGEFDAEVEKPDKFREYFVTNNFFESFMAGFPLRIAVGNKGSGKSALLRYSEMSERQKADKICVKLTLSDLVDRASDKLPSDRIRAINFWKNIFATEAASKILTSSLEEHLSSDAGRYLSSLPDFCSWIARLVSSKTKGASDIAIRAGLDLNKTREIIFYIDDLDKEWDGRSVGLLFVNSILNACYDIAKRDSNIKFRLAIRWDIYEAIARINQDIDKIRQNVIYLNWTVHEIYVIIANRIAKAIGLEFPYQMYLSTERDQNEIARVYDHIMDRVFKGLGKWDGAPTRHVLLSLVRNRPRDLIRLLKHAAEEANRLKKNRITSEHLTAIFPRYSDECMEDIKVEYGTRLAGLDKLLYSFKPTKAAGRAADKFKYTNDRIATHLKRQVESSRGVHFSYEKPSPPPDFRRILDFLYRIDFLRAWYHDKATGRIERAHFGQRQIVVSPVTDFGFSWEVLPAYRWAIQPTRLADVIESLD